VSARLASFCGLMALGLLQSGCDRKSRRREAVASNPVADTHRVTSALSAPHDEPRRDTADLVLNLPNGAAFIPGFRQPQYLGEFPAAHKQPFIVLSGFECSGCDTERSLLVRLPSD